jgi:hypothetical protein
MTRLLVSILLLAQTACTVGAGDDGGDDGGGDDGPGPGPGPGPDPGGDPTPSEFITEFAAAECMQAHACKAEFPAEEGVTFEDIFGADQAACVTLADEFYQPDGVAAAVTGGTIDYDGAAAGTCLAGLTSWGTCAQFWAGDSPIPAECDDVFAGTVADGGACMVDLECSGAESWCNNAVCAVDTGAP